MALLVFSGVRALGMHYDLIRFPYPLDSHEPAQLILSADYAAAKNPCALDSFPMKINVYGWAYNALMGRLCSLGFGCGLGFHRSVAALMLLACLGLQALVLRRLGSGVPESACLLLAAYGSLLLNVTPISRPDSLGLLLSTLGFTVPFLAGYRGWSLGLAAAAFSLAVATKLYFLLSPALLLAWLLLNRRWVSAALFGAFFAALSALLACWLLGQCDTYFYQNYLVKYNLKNFSGYSLVYMLWQLKEVFLLGLPGGLLLMALALSSRREGALGKIAGAEWWFYSLGGLMVFVASLGGHQGTRLTFAVQLVAWPMVPALGALAAALRPKRALALACLLLSAVCAVNLADHGGFSRLGQLARWTEAKMYASSARHPFSTCDLSSVLMGEGKEVFDSGFTEYFNPDASVPPGVARHFPLLPELNRRFLAYGAGQQRRISRREFDLVALTPYYYVPLPLQGNYRPFQRLILGYPQTGGSADLYFFCRIKPEAGGRAPR